VKWPPAWKLVSLSTERIVKESVTRILSAVSTEAEESPLLGAITRKLLVETVTD
jgi:hypothetical protein